MLLNKATQTITQLQLLYKGPLIGELRGFTEVDAFERLYEF